MTVEEIGALAGSLVFVKTELYWYAKQCWDKGSERFCILLDSTTPPSHLDWDANDLISATEGGGDGNDYVLQLLIDNKPQWVVLNTKSFEIVK